VKALRILQFRMTFGLIVQIYLLLVWFVCHFSFISFSFYLYFNFISVVTPRKHGFRLYRYLFAQSALSWCLYFFGDYQSI